MLRTYTVRRAGTAFLMRSLVVASLAEVSRMVTATRPKVEERVAISAFVAAMNSPDLALLAATSSMIRHSPWWGEPHGTRIPLPCNAA